MPTKTSSPNRGFALIEIVVVIAIIGTTFLSLYELAVLSRTTVSAQVRRTQALALAQEGLEAVRIIRDQSWSTNIAPLSVGTTYYATLSGSSWGLTTVNPGPIDGFLTRTLVFADVKRDANSNISSSGEMDPATRKVTSAVTWSERGTNQTVSLITFVTNFLEN